MSELKGFLTDFFNKSFEKSVNEKMMYYSYDFEHSEVHKYISNIIDIPLDDFIDYIYYNYDVYFLEASDVMQFSDFENCTLNICREIKNDGDKGYKFLEIGKLLLNDGEVRKNGAYIKYGENHAKSAYQFGLLSNISNTFFLSCIGFVINDLTIQKQEKLICRLILRNKLIKRFMYRCKVSERILYEDEVSFLSKSTRTRRKSNIKKLISILIENDEIDLHELLSRIEF